MNTLEIKKEESMEASNIRYYHFLSCTFWSTDGEIAKNYYNKLNTLKLASTKNNERTYTDTLSRQKIYIDRAFEILLNPDKKAKYLRFLYLNYSCSQPQSLEKLIKDYNCLVFPYYTFQTYYPKTSTDDCCDIRVLVLDFVNFTLTFYNKNEIDKVFLIDTINEVDEGHLKDEIDLTTNNDVFSFNILIKSQKSLILHLISFMQKTQSDKAKDPTVKNKIVEKNLSLNFNYKLNFTNSTNRNLINPADESLNRLKYLNELKMLENELYMPCGYILKNEGYKVGKKTSLKKKRYLLLGTTNLLIFKDEEFRYICNIIHLQPGSVLFSFNDKQLKMKIDTEKRSYVIYFYSSDTFSLWELTVHDIFNGNIIDRLDDDFDWFTKDTKEEDLDKAQLISDKLNKDLEEVEKKKKELNEKKKSLDDLICKIRQNASKPNSTRELQELIENSEFEKVYEKALEKPAKRKITRDDD